MSDNNRKTRSKGAPPDDAPELAPHSVDLEESVLGALLMNSGAWWDVEPHLTPDDFYILRHGWIYEAMQRVIGRGNPIDTRLLAQELEARGRLDEVGGDAYLNYLPNVTPSALYAEHYAMAVERLAIRRRLLGAAGEVARLAQDENVETPDAISQAQAAVMDVTFRSDTSGTISAGQAASELVDTLGEARLNNTQVLGIPSPFPDLDRHTGGWQSPDFVVVAGRPGMGKSALLLQFAYHAAKQGASVLFFSMEMDAKQIVRRAFAQEHGISYKQQMRMTDEQYALFVVFAGEVERLPLWFDDGAALSPYVMQRKAREHRRLHGLDLVVTDYLQLMRPDQRSKNKTDDMTDIAQAHKVLAREFRIPVMAASQLNRAVEARADKHPMLSDLRESGGIEQAADIVLFPYREGYYTGDKDNPKPADNVVDCDIAKHRNGVPGFVSMIWDGSRIRFLPATRQHVDLSKL